MKKLLAALCLVPGVAFAADVYRNTEWGFAVDQPAGWTALPPRSVDPPTVRVRLHGPDQKSAEVCNIAATDAPNTVKRTQAQINADIARGVLDETVLRETLSLDPGARRTAAEVAEVGGISAQLVEIHADIPFQGEKLRYVMLSMGLAVPGRTYFFNCTTIGEENFNRLKPDFEVLQRSFRVTPK